MKPVVDTSSGTTHGKLTDEENSSTTFTLNPCGVLNVGYCQRVLKTTLKLNHSHEVLKLLPDI